MESCSDISVSPLDTIVLSHHHMILKPWASTVTARTWCLARKEAANGGGPASTCSNSCWNVYPLQSDPRFPGIPQVVEEQLWGASPKKTLGFSLARFDFHSSSITKSPHRSSEPRRLTGSETLIASCCWLIQPGSRHNFGAPGYPRSDWGFKRSFLVMFKFK